MSTEAGLLETNTLLDVQQQNMRTVKEKPQIVQEEVQGVKLINTFHKHLCKRIKAESPTTQQKTLKSKTFSEKKKNYKSIGVHSSVCHKL